MKTNYLLILFALLLAIPQAADAKKKKDIAIQLYSVRDIINNGTDLNVVLKNLAQMGYTSIEAANYDNGKFYGKTPEEFKNAVEKAGMKVLSSHLSLIHILYSALTRGTSSVCSTTLPDSTATCCWDII